MGTHTHVQTADEQILPKGTGYITDLGMTGTTNSILGEKIETILEHYLIKTPHRYTLQEEGEMAIQGVLATINAEGVTTHIRRINLVVTE